MVAQLPASPEWVLLSYRVPREPSTPRIAIWRRLKDHGVAQIGDGLVALPLDARTKEQLEWVAAMAHEADGEAIVWVATTTKTDHAALVATLNAARDDEYQALIEAVGTAREEVGDNAFEPTRDHGGTRVDGRTVSRFRRELRRIERRDHFRSPRRADARAAVESLVDDTTTPDTKVVSS